MPGCRVLDGVATPHPMARRRWMLEPRAPGHHSLIGLWTPAKNSVGTALAPQLKHQVLAHRFGRGLGSRVDPQLAQDGLCLVLDGVDGAVQDRRDFAVALAMA